jgi:4-nitrophenyl phosphatase
MASTVATESQVKELLDSVDYILLDLDGVVYSGQTVIPQVPETLRYLRESGKHVRFISNTIILNRENLTVHLRAMGIDGVEPHEIYSAGYASALYVQEQFADAHDHLVHRNVFVVGPKGLHDEVQAVLAPGYVTYGPELNSVTYSPDMVARAWQEALLPVPKKWTDPTSHKDTSSEKKMISLAELDPVAVVVGVDYGLNMTQMACATALLQLTDARFVATNPDPADPAGPQRLLMPSSGSIVAAVKTAVGREPDVLCGKPSPTMGHLLFEKEEQDGRKVDPQRSLMVGDRLMTDICFGKKIGARTALSLSGAQKLADLEKLAQNGAKDELPDCVIESLAAFLPASTA